MNVIATWEHTFRRQNRGGTMVRLRLDAGETALRVPGYLTHRRMYLATDS